MTGILIGYEIGTGEPIGVEATHMVVTGITNQSGKTTMLEGMASRAKGFRFLVFKTKPHEQQFVTANEVKPFFRERCLVAGTKVVANPKIKDIETLQVGDKVLESSGSFTKVVNTFIHDFQGDLVRIKPQGLPEIQMTQNHPLLVAERLTVSWTMGEGHYSYGSPTWVLAMNLNKNHYLLVPRIKSKESFQINLKPYLKRGHTGIKGNLEITTNEDVAWMLGIYLADGGSWVGKKGGGFVRFYLGPHETGKAKRLQRIFERFGFHASANLRKCLEVQIKSLPLARFLRESFDSGAKNKTIPHFVYLLPKEQVKSFIQGWFDGDGCIVKSGRYDRFVGITVSEDIAYGLTVLGAKIGIPISISHSRPPKSGFPNYSSSERWCVEIAGDYATKFGFPEPRKRVRSRKAVKVDDNYLYIPIRSICLEPFKGKVYNIETDAHNYCIPVVSHNTDWEYVAGILEASRNERMKFERFWIMRASKGAESLRIVDKNCVKLMEDEKEGGLAYSMYYQLHEYFKNILPELESWNLGDNFPALTEGINVMDLGEMSDGVQMLIIESCLAHILKGEKRVITLIPELWKFSPEGKRSPVKEHLDRLIRQGAAGKNFVWFDSQDMANVDKGPLKQCYTWILGLQTERNEIKHTLDQINVPKKARPTTDQIASLSLGQFYLSTPKGVKHFYAAPIWLPAERAIQVAKGELASDQKEISDFKESYESGVQTTQSATKTTVRIQSIARAEESDEDRFLTRIDFAAHLAEQRKNSVSHEEFITLRDSVAALSAKIGDLQRATAQQGEALRRLEERKPAAATVSSQIQIDDSRMLLSITDHKDPHPLSTKNLEGKIAYMVYKILEGKASLPWEIAKAAADTRGWTINPKNFKRDCGGLLESGVLVMTDDGHYKAPKEIDVEFPVEQA